MTGGDHPILSFPAVALLESSWTNGLPVDADDDGRRTLWGRATKGPSPVRNRLLTPLLPHREPGTEG